MRTHTFVQLGFLMGLLLLEIGSASQFQSENAFKNVVYTNFETPQSSAVGIISKNITWGGIKDDEFAGITLDENGNAYICGKTNSSGVGMNDSILLNYDSDLNLKWSRLRGGVDEDNAENLVKDNNDHITMIGSGYNSTIVTQFNHTGDIEWNCTQKEQLFDAGSDITYDRLNDLYIASRSMDDSGKLDAILTRYDRFGHKNWSFFWNQSNSDYGTGIAVDLRNNLYFSGFFLNSTHYDVFLSKFSMEGECIWNRTWGGLGHDYGYAIAVDEAGFIYLVGSTLSYGAGSDDLFILKYDRSGNLIWNTTWGGVNSDIALGIATDRLGNVFLTGESRSFGFSNGDVIVLKFNNTGNLMWNISYGGTGTERGRGIAVDRYGDVVWVCGYITSWGSGARDGFVLKIDDSRPMISQANHLTFDIFDNNKSFNLTLNDTTISNGTYIVYLNGLEYQKGAWADGLIFGINFFDLKTGNYNFTIYAWDGTGDFAIETVMVTIYTINWTWVIIGAIIVVVLVIAIVGLKKIEKPWGKGVLSAFAAIIIVGAVLLGYFVPSFMFSVNGRYDDTKLNTLGLPFESADDLYFHDGGYSNSSDCPWGREHLGIDFAFKNGTSVIAAAPGRVDSISLIINDKANVNENMYFINVQIRFNKSIMLTYNFEPWTINITHRDWQVSLLKIKVGDWVIKGQEIALFVKIGPAAHVHFGVNEGMFDQEWQSPSKFMGAEDAAKMVALLHSYQPNRDFTYPEMNLYAMWIPFDKVGDNRDFRESYSNSTNCPWGFAHVGVDFFLKNNTKILASTSGTILNVSVHDNGAGSYIRYYIRIQLQYNATFEIHYSIELVTDDYANITHQLSMIKVKVGDHVEFGQEIGRFLNCGGDGDHLDWGVLDHYVRICPKPYLSPLQYDRMMDLIQRFHPTWNLCY